MSTLSKCHFEQHPIWSEYYDYDEREEIIEWGVDSIWLAAELEHVHNGSDHCAYPILRPYPLPERMRLYIKARITTAENDILDGYVMNEDAYVLVIFAADHKFCFSRMFSDLNQKELARLKASLSKSMNKIFPVQYETDFLDSKSNLIAGTFSLQYYVKP
jgi:hypothetical protein